MVHSYHEGLPGYHEDQILHDGCEECEARAKVYDHGIANLDHTRFARAWARAAEWNCHGLATISDAERPLLATLWTMQVQLERFGVPIGSVPHA